MLRDKLLLLFLVFTGFAFSQEKKTDTVFVYEEVIVYDTVFVEKPFTKIDKAVFTSEADKKDRLEIIQNGKKFQVAIDTLVLVTDKKRIEKQRPQTWFFGGKLHLGLARNSLFKEMNAPNTIGLGLGIWTRKALFNSDFSVGIGFDAFYWIGSFSFDATQNESVLNGYYFTNNRQPKLFKTIDCTNFKLQLPIQLYYNINKFTPSVGAFACTSNYKSQFIGSSGNLPLTFDEIQDFKAEALHIGYLIELHYSLSKHISVALHFSSGKANNLFFSKRDDKNQFFKTKNTFIENNFLIQLLYTL
ncbi:MAG TPA: hypothetical protein PK776_06960 [Flavobacterium sp.]|nr:hypothetical protein [Flavobacterium sp.]